MLLGLDLGTGSVKTILLSPEGDVLGEGTAAYKVRSPRSGWAESDPAEWWSAVVAATESALGGRGAQVEGVGLSGQMHGVVLSDGDGSALRPAVLWPDARSSEQLAAYRDLDATLRRGLANPVTTGMAGASLLWLRDHEPDVYAQARWALQPKDWLRLRLTGEVAAEPSDASATLLYDLPKDDWAFGVVEALGLRGELLAPLVPSGSAAGGLTPRAAEDLGLRAGIPVAAGAGDTAAAMLGSGLFELGEAQLTVGTGGQIVVVENRAVPDPRGRTHLYRTASGGASRWYSMAAIQNAGLALEWARTILGASWDEVYAEAFAVTPGAEGVTFLPYVSGERTPHFDPAARGAWTGLGLGHDRGHLLRAALEGVAFALREGLEALEDRGTPIQKSLRLAGGGTRDDRWRRLLANALNRPLSILPDGVATIASARGAALLAGVACGSHPSVEEAVAKPEPVTTVHPDAERDAYDAAYTVYKALYPRLRL